MSVHQEPVAELRNEPTAVTTPGTRSEPRRSPLDWMFRNRQTGRITVAQWPNIPLGAFLLTVVARWVIPTGTAVRTVVTCIGVGALAWWALGELIRGVNPWRRLLGLGGLAFAVGGLVSLAR